MQTSRRMIAAARSTPPSVPILRVVSNGSPTVPARSRPGSYSPMAGSTGAAATTELTGGNMDYPVLNRTPDVAQAIVPHTIDGNGNAVAIGVGNGMPVQKAGNSSTSGALSSTGSVSTAAGGFSGGAVQINGAPVG